MSKHKPAGKEKDKGVQLVIRIAKAERAAFVALCEDLDTTAAREIRRFMREFVASRSPAPDAEAVPESSPAPRPAAVDPAPGAPTLKVAKPARTAKATPAKASAEPLAAPSETPAAAIEAGPDQSDAPQNRRKRVKS